MNIGDVNYTGSNRLDANRLGRNGRASELRQVDAGSQAGAAQDAAEKEGAKDQVQISDAGRKAQAEAASEVERARQVLRASEPSEARLDEIRSQVSEGYYNQPEVIDQTAEGLLGDLSGS